MRGSHAHETILGAGEGGKDQVGPCYPGLSSHALRGDCVLKVTERQARFLRPRQERACT